MSWKPPSSLHCRAFTGTRTHNSLPPTASRCTATQMMSSTNRQVIAGQSYVVKKEVRTVTGSSALNSEKWETVTTETVSTDGGKQTRTVVTTSTSGGPSNLDDFVKRFDKALPAGFHDDQPKKLPASTSTSSKQAPKPASSSAGTASDTEFAKEVLECHNKYRAKHNVPPLQLSAELNKYAKEWVENLARKDKFEHRQNNKYGENIFMKWHSDPNFQISGSEPCDSWYSEIKDHTFGQEPRSLRSGHFSQVVWRESKLLGVARAKSKSGKVIVVANYDPAGNFLGKFAANVPPPK